MTQKPKDMKLSSSDILRLYGKNLFIIPEKAKTDPLVEKEAEEPPASLIEKPEKENNPIEETKQDLSFLRSGPPIVWKMKPGAQLALILKKSEFSDRALTGLLKVSISKAGIDPAVVGFGIIEDNIQAVDLQDMSVSLGLICKHIGSSISSPIDLDGKKIWLLPALSEIASHPEKQAELDKALVDLAGNL